jgi:hypothetical protein
MTACPATSADLCAAASAVRFRSVRATLFGRDHVITTTVQHSVEEIAAEYRRLTVAPPLHESVGWLRYCDRRSHGGMRYVAARDAGNRLVGLTALRATCDRSTASATYDVVRLVWPAGAPPAARDRYPQLFAAVSGVRCLFTAADATVRTALVKGAMALADATRSVLAFAYLSEEDTAGEIAALAGADRHADGGAAGAVGPQVRCRTAVPEVLADYDDLADTVDEHVVVFLAERAGRTVGVCLCLRDGATLHIRGVGFDCSLAGNDFVYFNLMFYEPIRWGVANGVSCLRFGTGAYAAKCRRGCVLEPLYGVVRWPAWVAGACRATLAERERYVRAELGALR